MISSILTKAKLIHRSAIGTAQRVGQPGDLGPLPEWNLADLYASMEDPAYGRDTARAAADAQAFAGDYKGRLSDLAAGPGAGVALLEAITRYEALDDLLGRLVSYASLVYVGDTADPARAKFYGDAQERVTAISSDLLFFTLEINRIDDAVLEGAAAREPLHRYKPWLDDIRKERPFQLDDKLEQLFHEKSVTGRGAWNRLFDETITSLRFTVGPETLTLEPVLNLLQDTRPERREQAAKALGATLGENLRTFALITNTLAKDLEISNRWRGFSGVADSRHLGNRVEPEVVDALTSAVEGAYPRLSHRYYKLKARWFGRDQLDFWDRNAPLPHLPAITYPWSDAQGIVLEAYGAFSPKLSGIAKRFFDDRWIDAGLRPGKAPGAFAHPTVPSAHPYILLNYQGRARDVMTLAHELGHGVHQVLAAPRGALMAPTPLTLAETASVFGEMLTFKSMLGRAETPGARFGLLASKVEDMLNTVVRQIAFYTFERALHEERKVGELTAERIGELWMTVQRNSLGDGIRLGPGYEAFWAYIPHFVHSPFYVYAYAFGDCLVNSLYGVYQNAPDGFADRYLAMLSAGGTKHHAELLAPFGLDARNPGFWQIGLDLIDGMITELEASEVA